MKEQTSSENKMAQIAVTVARAEVKKQQRFKFKWHSKAVDIIKDQLKARKEKNLPNDWKIKFYETKLKDKKSILGRLAKLIK